MRCAYEMIECFCSVAKPYCRKIVLFFKKPKPHLNLKTFAKITCYWGPQTHPSEVLQFLPDIYDVYTANILRFYRGYCKRVETTKGWRLLLFGYCWCRWFMLHFKLHRLDIYATYWMCLVHEVTGYVLCSVSLWTVMAMSVDRLPVILLGLSYKAIATLRRIIPFQLSSGCYVQSLVYVWMQITVEPFSAASY